MKCNLHVYKHHYTDEENKVLYFCASGMDIAEMFEGRVEDKWQMFEGRVEDKWLNNLIWRACTPRITMRTVYNNLLSCFNHGIL